MNTPTFHPWTPQRLGYIARHMRAQDRRELAITSPGERLERVLEDSARASRWAIVVEVDGRPAIVYGVAQAQSDARIGVPWMIATDDLLRIRRDFVAVCRNEVRLMEQRFVLLTNEVHRHNTVAIRWLEWMGFTVDRTRPVGPGGEMRVFWKGEAVHV